MRKRSERGRGGVRKGQRERGRERGSEGGTEGEKEGEGGESNTQDLLLHSRPASQKVPGEVATSGLGHHTNETAV